MAEPRLGRGVAALVPLPCPNSPGLLLHNDTESGAQTADRGGGESRLAKMGRAALWDFPSILAMVSYPCSALLSCSSSCSLEVPCVRLFLSSLLPRWRHLVSLLRATTAAQAGQAMVEQPSARAAPPVRAASPAPAAQPKPVEALARVEAHRRSLQAPARTSRSIAPPSADSTAAASFPSWVAARPT